MSKSSQIEYSECMTLVTMVVTIYMCEYWKNTYTLIQKHFLSCSHSFHAFHSPVSFLSVSCQFPFTSFHVPSISVNHIFVLRSPYTISLLSFCSVLLMFLWFPFPFVSFSFSSSFHVPFILLSCHFSFLPFFLQVIFHFSCMSCHFSKSYRISVHYVHGPWFFSWSSLLVYASGCQFIMW